MNAKELRAILADNSGEYLKFDRIEAPRSKRPDLHAFLLLESLVPGTEDIVAGAHHDEFFIGVELEALAQVVTEGQVIELIRCGIRIDEDGLCMFA